MEDLYLKLQSSEIVLRPLRARLEDVPILVQFLLEDIGRDFGGATPGIEHAALRALQIQDWPGNIRALRAVLEDAMLLSSGRKIMLEHVDAARRKNEKPSVQPKEITERDWIGDALRRNRFRRCETAAFLGISRKTLYSKIKHYGLLAER